MTAFKNSGALTIVQGRGELSNKEYYDSQNGTVVEMTPNSFNAAAKLDPSRYVEYNNTTKATLNAQSLVNGIHDSINQVRTDFNSGVAFDKATTALMSVAMRSNDESTINTLKAKLANENLPPEALSAANNLLTLHERLLSMRSLQAAGAGSESQRAAVVSLAPSLGDSKVSATQKLDNLENEIGNISSAIPRIGSSKVSAGDKRKAATPGPAVGGAKVGYTIQSNGHTYTVTSVDASGKVTGAS